MSSPQSLDRESGRFFCQLLLSTGAALLPFFVLALAEFSAPAMELYRREGLLLALAVSLVFAWMGARRLAAPVRVLSAIVSHVPGAGNAPPATSGLSGEFGLLASKLQALVSSLRSSRESETAAHRNFQRIFEALPVPASLYSGDLGKLLQVNDAFCRAYQLPRDALIGKTLDDYGLGLTPEARPLFKGALALEGRITNLELPVRAPAGEIRRVLTSVEYLEIQGQPHLLTVQVDVTDRLTAERARLETARALAANAAKTKFLSRMSHELRTPLNAVLGFSQLLQQSTQQQLNADQARQLELVQRAGEQLGALIDDVLDLSRIEAGSLTVDLERVHLHGLLEDVMQLCSNQALEYEVKLVTQFDPILGPAVKTDPIRLQQVLLNVVSNAIKYNRPGGEVRLTVSQDGDQAMVVVQDTGLGMSEAQLAEIYQPFNRLGRERTAVPGTGIGLALTRELMGLLDGSIDIQSLEGQGTTVSLLLPCSSAAVARPLPAPKLAPQPGASAVEPVGTVLYIEDIELNAFLVQNLLAPWKGVTLVVAGTGEEGLRLAAELQPQLVLLDMHLPDMDGFEVLERLRDKDETKSLPVVALSANAMPEDVAAALTAGALEYWTKPINFEQFHQGVRHWLAH